MQYFVFPDTVRSRDRNNSYSFIVQSAQTFANYTCIQKKYCCSGKEYRIRPTCMYVYNILAVSLSASIATSKRRWSGIYGCSPSQQPGTFCTGASLEKVIRNVSCTITSPHDGLHIAPGHGERAYYGDINRCEREFRVFCVCLCLKRLYQY